MTNEQRAQEYADLYTRLGDRWRQCVPVDGRADKHADRMTVGSVTIVKPAGSAVWQVERVKNGDVFTSAEGFTIVVRRTARDLSWADIKVVQPGGATWTKRQILRDGQLPYTAERVPAGQDGGGRGC